MPRRISGSARGRRSLRRRWRRRGAHGAGGLDEGGVDLADAERGVADGGGDGVEDDGDHGGELADAEEHDDRDEVDEGGEGLEGVDDRLHDAPGALAEAGGDADGQADQGGDEDGGADEVDRHHGLRPVAGEGDEEGEGAGDGAAAGAADAGHGEGDEERAPPPGDGGEDAADGDEEVDEDPGLYRLEGVEEGDVQPLDEAGPEGGGGDLQPLGVVGDGGDRRAPAPRGPGRRRLRRRGGGGRRPGGWRRPG